MCRRENLTHVHYIYGDELKQSAGQARSRTELATLATSAREIQVYVVEVCRGCGWNHLVEQFLLGREALDPNTAVVPLGDGASPSGVVLRQPRPPWLVLTATERGCPQPAPNGKV